MINIIGVPSTIPRIETGFYSLDHAFSDQKPGVPGKWGFEIFGQNHVGKSTFVYSLAAILAQKSGGSVALADFEGFDPEYLETIMGNTGFSGNVHIVQDDSDEQQLEKLLELLDKDCSVGILDSIGAISPMQEQDNDIGEANMGRRALILAQFCRKAVHLMRMSSKPKVILMTNHWIPQIGKPGYDTPGGEAKKYLAAVRILLKRDTEFPDASYVLSGEIKKNRWGILGRKFYIFVVSGYGIHPGLSAVWDCIMNKTATYVNGVIRIGDTSFGRLSSIVKAVKSGNEFDFSPFMIQEPNNQEPIVESVSEEE